MPSEAPSDSTDRSPLLRASAVTATTVAAVSLLLNGLTVLAVPGLVNLSFLVIALTGAWTCALLAAGWTLVLASAAGSGPRHSLWLGAAGVLAIVVKGLFFGVVGTATILAARERGWPMTTLVGINAPDRDAA